MLRLRRDLIVESFLSHELLKTKYELNDDKIPKNLSDALKSNVPIVKAIALIVEKLESAPNTTENEMRNIVLQYLNTAI
jgi:hypothetical protein